ncbi:MAG: cystathionine beta-lyase [Xanthobacteraceae bacterium]|nr:MAG: cystathionine beta-lyase [Xanthobacteraceae bacterium]
MSRPPSDTQPPLDPATLLVTGGRDTAAQKGFVNPPVVHGSTVLYPSAEDLLAHRGEYHYGRHGSPTTRALTQALQELEGSNCAGVALAPSGVSAISAALLAVLKAGDHLLVSDSIYRPTRSMCDDLLLGLGIETTYFDPLIGAGITSLFRDNTRAVFLEAPGSQSLDMSDIPAIAAVARARGIWIINDNTWATPLLFRSLDKGVDLSVQSATKYIGGHSDIMLGTVAANGRAWPKLAAAIRLLGLCAGPDDVFLALRGLRTLAVRLARHQAAGIEMANWLAARPEVLRVLHPALPGDPGHAIWKRDFSGACGLFSVILRPAPQAAVNAFLNSLRLFGMGFSWGGFESLVIPFDCASYRTATVWQPGGPGLRFHIGLENLDDLKADLAQGFEVLAKAR